MTSHTPTWPSVVLGWACLSFVTCGRWQKIHMWKIFSLHQSVWEDSSKPVFVTPGFGKGALHCPSRCCPLRIAAFQREAKKRWQERRCLMSHPKRQKLTKGSALLEGGTLEKYRKVTEELCRNASNKKQSTYMRYYCKAQLLHSTHPKPMASVALMCEAEKDLIFAGFIAFECLVRKDSALVIGALNESGHKVLCS